MKKTKILFLILSLLFLTLCNGYVGQKSIRFFAPPLPGLDIGRCPVDHVHQIPDVNFLRSIGLSEKSIQQAIGATGTKNLAVILVNFQSASATATSGSPTMSSTDIQNVATMVTGLRNYYLEVSGNSLTINPTYIYSGGTKTFSQGLAGSETPFTMTQSMEYYGNDLGGNIDPSVAALFSEAISAAGITKDSPYNAVMIVHAGFGEESTLVGGDIWSQFIDKISPSVNGFTEGTFVPVKERNAEPLGVMCHEFGHQLGLPDLYNTTPPTSKTVVGYWCLMDFGTWGGSPKPGSKPSHPSVWCKNLLGWINPTVTSGTKTLTVNNTEKNKTSASYQFLILNSTTEYFLIEYRHKILYDEQLPGEGILIWHIDDTIGDVSRNNINTDTTHPRVRLVEADRDNRLIETPENKSDKGSANDPFKSSSEIFTIPQSDSYGGASSGITLGNFSGVGGNFMTVDSFVLSSTTDLQLKKVLAFPNPSRDGSPVRIRGIFTRPISSGNIKIYNIPGELVRESSITSSNISISSSKDYEWVYDYVWDLTNSSGNTVSPGVYVYVFEATISDTEKQVKVGKLAIIR